jgi:hypothetical protein
VAVHTRGSLVFTIDGALLVLAFFELSAPRTAKRKTRAQNKIRTQKKAAEVSAA